ncbi:MAG: hypothetical protein H6Q37_137, partial [Chloroflexi bacterium]|nr:hypothetical protein [Chloroflexota bacterium]
MSRKKRQTSTSQKSVRQSARRPHQVSYLIIGLFLVGLLAALLRRWLIRRRSVGKPAAPPQEIPLEVVPVHAPPMVELPAPPQVLPLPLGEVSAPPEVVIGIPVEEAEVSFEFPGVAVAPLIPDIYVPLPADMLLENDEPVVMPDGKILNPQFNWQNPNLLGKIYPFRTDKLRDFLLYFSEIDLVQDFKAKGESDPSTQARMEQSKAAMQARRQQVVDALNAAIDEKIHVQCDIWFEKVCQSPSSSLRFRQTYYINQEINRLQGQLDDLQASKSSILRKVDWWPNQPVRQQAIRDQAAPLDDKIKEVQDKMALPKKIQDLLQQEAELPGDDLSLQDILHWELRQKKELWTNMDQNALLKEIILWINREPDRFPEWLIYMVIHFSGMRYMSAHSSWASPRDLLEMFKHEDITDEVKALGGNDLTVACQSALQRLLAVPPPADPLKKADRDR